MPRNLPEKVRICAQMNSAPFRKNWCIFEDRFRRQNRAEALNMCKKFFKLFVPVWAMGLQPCKSHFLLKLAKHAGHSSIGVKRCQQVIVAS
ncbi:hypothetical protein EEB11_06190 [Pseudotabrizicola sediminis]|uniref:Transposase n=1 Tax=Pseudotabrizicola sediminis TaxID=2486418 RepID=A0ABY2KRT6_9RHOB|nr:hypothetical protein EEB11_06190 [Pseudotabrizicola sediminis]